MSEGTILLAVIGAFLAIPPMIAVAISGLPTNQQQFIGRQRRILRTARVAPAIVNRTMDRIRVATGALVFLALVGAVAWLVG